MFGNSPLAEIVALYGEPDPDAYMPIGPIELMPWQRGYREWPLPESVTGASATGVPLCACGCGEPIGINKNGDKRKGFKRGHIWRYRRANQVIAMEAR